MQEEKTTAQDEATPETALEEQGTEANAEQAQSEESTDWQDKYLRLYAEFDNFRKRTMRERGELIRNAGMDVMEKMLPILDDFDAVNESIRTSPPIITTSRPPETRTLPMTGSDGKTSR